MQTNQIYTSTKTHTRAHKHLHKQTYTSTQTRKQANTHITHTYTQRVTDKNIQTDRIPKHRDTYEQTHNKNKIQRHIPSNTNNQTCMPKNHKYMHTKNQTKNANAHPHTHIHRYRQNSSAHNGNVMVP